MKFRILTAVALAGALVLSISGAEAATPVMDGKKVKVLKLSASPGVQDNTTTMVAGEDREYCTTKCARLPFVYKPAKGVKGGLMFTATWTNLASDVDLTVVEQSGKKVFTTVGGCNGAGRASEKVYLAPNQLKSGKTYVMIMYFFRSINETFDGKVEIGVPSTIPTTVPARADEVALVNCTL